MKKSFILFLFCNISILSFAQINAITDSGEPVTLQLDGTWSYTNKDTTPAKEITTNPTPFTKSNSNSFLLKSTKAKIGVWLDPKKWSFKKAMNNEAAEYELQLKDGDLYGMLITEQIEIPLEFLRKQALENAKSVAPDAMIIKEEYRTVNGLKVLLLQLNGTTEGIKFSYYGYYYSNENGTVQFVTYTASKLLSKYQKTSEDILNGLVLLD